MSDARFTDGKDEPLRLLVRDPQDFTVISALLQDSIAERKEMLYEPKRQSFSLLLRRFRWEDEARAKKEARAYERIGSVLIFRNVQHVRINGFDNQDMTLVFDLIALEIVHLETARCVIRLIFAGDASIEIESEEMNLSLTDVTKPYKVKIVPTHEVAKDA